MRSGGPPVLVKLCSASSHGMGGWSVSSPLAHLWRQEGQKSSGLRQESSEASDL